MSLQQKLVITLVEVEPVNIHHSPYYQIRYRVEGEARIQEMRINPEAFYPDPQPGDRVEVNLLMGNIMGASRL